MQCLTQVKPVTPLLKFFVFNLDIRYVKNSCKGTIINLLFVLEKEKNAWSFVDMKTFDKLILLIQHGPLPQRLLTGVHA